MIRPACPLCNLAITDHAITKSISQNSDLYSKECATSSLREIRNDAFERIPKHIELAMSISILRSKNLSYDSILGSLAPKNFDSLRPGDLFFSVIDTLQTPVEDVSSNEYETSNDISTAILSIPKKPLISRNHPVNTTKNFSRETRKIAKVCGVKL
jgi:hypothetical protein